MFTTARARAKLARPPPNQQSKRHNPYAAPIEGSGSSKGGVDAVPPIRQRWDLRRKRPSQLHADEAYGTSPMSSGRSRTVSSNITPAAGAKIASASGSEGAPWDAVQDHGMDVSRGAGHGGGNAQALTQSRLMSASTISAFSGGLMHM